MGITSSFLDSLEEVHPDIMRKPKLHSLVHLLDDMSNFGPAVGFATERFDINARKTDKFGWLVSHIILSYLLFFQ